MFCCYVAVLPNLQNMTGLGRVTHEDDYSMVPPFLISKKGDKECLFKFSTRVFASKYQDTHSVSTYWDGERGHRDNVGA